MTQRQIKLVENYIRKVVRKTLKESKTISPSQRSNIVSTFKHKLEEDEISNIIDLYLSGKSQAEIEKETKANFNLIVAITNKLPHISVGKDNFEDDRFGDDPSSKQYYDRTIKR